MELQPIQDSPGLRRWEGLVERAGGVGVQVVLHQIDALGIGVALLDQVAQALGVVLLGPVLGHRHMPPAGQRLDHHEEVGGPVPLILVVAPLHVPRSQRQRRPYVGMQHDRLLVEADGGVARVVGHRVERQDI
ncbi:MAG TPA: hypothetical protein VGS80_04540, partial [Ktedonobacterales bacterium]|nr:hypothetical protein [Ktedonobacterales bacterium]